MATCHSPHPQALVFGAVPFTSARLCSQDLNCVSLANGGEKQGHRPRASAEGWHLFGLLSEVSWHRHSQPHFRRPTAISCPCSLYYFHGHIERVNHLFASHFRYERQSSASYRYMPHATSVPCLPHDGPSTLHYQYALPKLTYILVGWLNDGLFVYSFSFLLLPQ